jgi:hypothetical protein
MDIKDILDEYPEDNELETSTVGEGSHSDHRAGGKLYIPGSPLPGSSLIEQVYPAGAPSPLPAPVVKNIYDTPVSTLHVLRRVQNG